MSAVTSDDSQDRGGEAPSARGIGGLVLAAGLLLNPWFTGSLLARDGRVDQPLFLPVVLSIDVALVCAGAFLLVRSPVLGAKLRTAGLALASALVLLGIAAPARWAKNALHRAPTVPAKAEPGRAARPAHEAAVIREPAELRDWLHSTPNRFFYEGWIDQLELAFERAETSGRTRDRVVARMRLSDELLKFGRNDESREHLQRALELCTTPDEHGLLQIVRRKLAIALMRGGEVSHCIAHHNPESCLFPIRKGGVWAQPANAERAAELFETFLEDDPENLSAVWLLNLCHMVKGTYPDGLAPEHRIPPEVIDSTVDVPRFRDLAPALGLDVLDLAGGAVMDDMDGDGFLDVVTSTQDPAGSMHYFHNAGDGTFADWTERAGLAGQIGGLNLLQADYDDDGRLDLFLLRGAWFGPVFGRQRNSLLHQEPDGAFRDVSLESGIGEHAFPCLAGAWADYDLDGDLDLYVGNEDFPCELWRNEGNGTFVDVAREAGVENGTITKGVAWGDYDDDGDPDLYVSNLGGGNRFYRNEGDGTFTEIAELLGIGMKDSPTRARTFNSWFFDYDGDGKLDLFVAGFGALLKMVASDYLGKPASGEPLHLFRNLGGSFADVSAETGIDHVRLPMGGNYGDVDNDGWPDVYLATGGPAFESLVPNVLYKNLEGRRFVDATASAGVGHLQKGHGVAFGDLDNDGDQDVLAQMGGLYPADRFHNALFENAGTTNHWVTILLRGERSNHFGVGARIRVDVRRPEGGKRSIHVVAGSGGSFGASSLQQEIGLGDAEAIERVEIFWPASGLRQVVAGVPLDSFVLVHEGTQGFELLERKRVRLSG